MDFIGGAIKEMEVTTAVSGQWEAAAPLADGG